MPGGTEEGEWKPPNRVTKVPEVRVLMTQGWLPKAGPVFQDVQAMAGPGSGMFVYARASPQDPSRPPAAPQPQIYAERVAPQAGPVPYGMQATVGPSSGMFTQAGAPPQDRSRQPATSQHRAYAEEWPTVGSQAWPPTLGHHPGA